MKCHKCKDQGKKSTISIGIGTSTSAYYTPHYDEDGKHHFHDSNECIQSYNCSNGHIWTETSYGSCWCGWTGGKTKITYQDDEE